MKKIWVLGGTSQGQMIADALAKRKVHAIMTAETEQGEVLIEKKENIEILRQQMKQAQMQAFIQKHAVCCMINAASLNSGELSENAEFACKNEKIHYIRLARQMSNLNAVILAFESYEQAVQMLNQTSGNVVLTTGAKELDIFTQVHDFEHRVFPGILPDLDAVTHCLSLGYKLQNIWAMQGSFSKAVNCAMFEKYQARYLVMKNDGSLDGWAKNNAAATECDMKVVLVGKPENFSGVDIDEAIEMAYNIYSTENKKYSDSDSDSDSDMDIVREDVNNLSQRDKCMDYFDIHAVSAKKADEESAGAPRF